MSAAIQTAGGYAQTQAEINAVQVVERLDDAWKKSRLIAASMRDGGADFLRMILNAILAIIRRIAAFFGVSFSGPDSSPATTSDSDLTNLQDLGEKVKFSGDPGAVAQAQKAVTGPLAVMAGVLADAAPAADRLASADGPAFLEDALSKLKAHILELMAAHKRLIDENESNLEAARISLNAADWAAVYAMMQAGGGAGLVDPKSELSQVLEQLTAIEDQLKNEQAAFCAYCVAAFDSNEMRPIAQKALSAKGFESLKSRVEEMVKSQNNDVFVNNSIVQTPESRNNLVEVDFTKKPVQKGRGQELTSEFVSDLPVEQRAPVGVSRFAAISREPVGDMSGSDENDDQNEQKPMREGSTHDQ